MLKQFIPPYQMSNLFFCALTTTYFTKTPQRHNSKTVGLGYGAEQLNHPKNEPLTSQSQPHQPSSYPTNVKISEKEREIRSRANNKNFLVKFFRSNIASILVFFFYLITLETILSCLLTVGLTLYWYIVAKDERVPDWNGGGIDWVVLGFAVVTPITVSIRLAFQRRERALYQISQLRSFSFQLYLAHAIWDWDGGNGRENLSCNSNRIDDGSGTKVSAENLARSISKGIVTDSVDWVEHSDKVLEHLVVIGDELSRFLTLPTSSRSSYRMLKSGRQEAGEIVELQYKLFDSFYTKRVTKLSMLTEQLKSMGLSATEGSRLRQYERYIGEAIEGLRMHKMYRTPQALRSFGRIFTVLLPPLYAPSFSQLAFDLHSLTMGILFAVITPLCLTALFESVQAIEDPFVGWITLDGIDVAEELEVLHWHQLINARKEIYPQAPDFVVRKMDETGEMLWQRAEGSIFDLSLLGDGSSVQRPGAGMDGSARISQYAMDTSSRTRKQSGGKDSVGMDGSERISHFAMDASGRSRRF